MCDHLWHLWPKCDQLCFAKKTTKNLERVTEVMNSGVWHFVTVTNVTNGLTLSVLVPTLFLFLFGIRIGTTLSNSYFSGSSKVTFLFTNWFGFSTSFYTSWSSLSCTYSCACQHARLARFGVRGDEVFSRQLCKQKSIEPGQHLKKKNLFRKCTSTTACDLNYSCATWFRYNRHFQVPINRGNPGIFFFLFVCFLFLCFRVFLCAWNLDAFDVIDVIWFIHKCCMFQSYVWLTIFI